MVVTDSDLITVETVSSLFEREGFVDSSRLEFRWSFVVFLEEKLVASIDSLDNILYCLGVKGFPMSKSRLFLQFRDVNLNPICPKILTIESVVSSAQSNTVISTLKFFELPPGPQLEKLQDTRLKRLPPVRLPLYRKWQ